MHSFFAYTNLTKPGLHVWREGTSIKRSLHPVAGSSGPGWVEFQCELDPSIRQKVRFMLFSFQEDGSPGEFENDAFQRELPRDESGDYPEAAWFVAGASRVVLEDPRAGAQSTLRVHLISQSRFRPAELFVWDAATGVGRRLAQSDEDALGPIFDLVLAPRERSLFNFKFVGRVQGESGFGLFEPDVANRLWVAGDGTEIWLHSGTATIARSVPETRTLTLHFRQAIHVPALMHLWAVDGDYATDVKGVPGTDGWTAYSSQIYTQLPYGCRFRNPGLPDEWESEEAKRLGIRISQDTQLWTLEGDSALFTEPPTPNIQLDLTVANKELSSLEGPLRAHVWVNRARGPLAVNVPVDDNNQVSLNVYPRVTTSIKFHDTHGHWEHNRHAIRAHNGTASGRDTPIHRYVVLNRPPLLAHEPVADLVSDPPFTIRRPGAYAEGDELRFAVHAPHAANVQLIGQWTGWLSNPIQMRSTFDGSYWWASLKIADLLASMPDSTTDYHGIQYQFVFNHVDRLQDPAAGWVERSQPTSVSRLVNHGRFDWRNQQWNRPTADYLVIYQLHPQRFTNRFQDERPLRRVAREIADSAGYFRELGVTAIQLLPVNEVGSSNSWGYDPAYFYAVENDYCGPDGPDDLKHLVYTCHQHGLAVVLDVVFNHAGGDNVLWDVARDSFFDGDTQWGALVNFDHPQCQHFFAQNLVYLANEFRIDAFRFDHTATIVHSAAWDSWSGSVRVLGSGGGWQFLHHLRQAVQSQVGPNCLLMAEHLPNEWSLTNFGGPMDSQWGDDFHDRLIDACRRQFGMSRLANALGLSHTVSDDWYKIVNYPESHDEVGNVRDRVAWVAGFGYGWRMSKVAAAATLLSRGIPLFFMGAESGEDKQFRFDRSDSLDIEEYLRNADRGRIRAWWKALGQLRRHHESIRGPAPLMVCYANDQILAFTRGQSGDFFVLLNFGGWSGFMNLSDLNLPYGQYLELWNSTWPAFAIRAEGENERTNGGRNARLQRHDQLHIPDYSALILQRI